MPIRLNDLEAAFRLRAEKAIKSLEETLDRIQATDEGLEKLQSRFDKVSDSGGKLAVVGGAITGALALAAATATEGEKSFSAVRGALEAQGIAFDENEEQIRSWQTAISRSTGIELFDLNTALAKAVSATGDLTEAQRLSERAAKLQAAGFGAADSIVEKLNEAYRGNINAIVDILPQYVDFEEQVEAGASRTELFEQALSDLNRTIDSIPPPTGIVSATRATETLLDTLGRAANEALAPFTDRLITLIDKGTELADSPLGRQSIVFLAFAGVISTLTGSILIFVGKVANAIIVLTGAGGLAGAMNIVTGAASKLALAVGSASAVSLGLIALAAAVTIAVVELNKLSKAIDDIDEGIRRADNLPKFRAEAAALRGTIRQLEEGTIDAKEATEEFNRFGLQSVEQAEQRIEALDRIIPRLQAQRDLEKEVADTQQREPFDLGAGDFGDTQAGTIDTLNRTIGLLDEEESKIRDILFAFDQGTLKAADAAMQLQELGFQSRAAAQDRLLALEEERTGLEQKRDLEVEIAEGLLNEIANREVKIEKLEEERTLVHDIRDEQGRLIPPVTEQISLVEDVNAEWEAFKANVGASLAPAGNLTRIFQQRLPGIVQNAASLTFELGKGLITGSNEAANALGALFKQLLADLARAIAEALILKGILSTLGGGGIIGRAVGFIGGLFQNPLLDQLARFEGNRFIDLFAQGAIGGFRDQFDSGRLAELSGDEIRSTGAPAFAVEINEATPETWIRITDEEVEPRVRELSTQRTGVAPSQGAL